MNLSTSGLKALEAREGCRLSAYQDTRGVWTIGTGHTGTYNGVAIHKGMRITQAEADALLAMDVAVFCKGVAYYVKVPLNQNQFDALVSFAFNIGLHGFAGSSTLKALNAKQYSTAADDMLMWEKPPELKRRREGERSQFLTPTTPTATKSATKNVAPIMQEKPMSTDVVKAAQTAGVDILAGLKNTFGNVISTIEASTKAATSDNVPQVTTSDNTGSGNVIVATVSDAQSAIGEIKQIISDIDAKKYSAIPEDVFHILTTVFAVLSRFNINVPGASIAMTILADIATVI